MSKEKKFQFNPTPPALSQDIVSEVTDEHLLDFYLTMPKKLRDDYFINTASAAEIAGVTQRTIQLWIKSGVIRAIRIGRRYKVTLASLKEYRQRQAGKKVC